MKQSTISLVLLPFAALCIAHTSPADPDCWFSQTVCPPAPRAPVSTVQQPPPAQQTGDDFGPYLS